MHQHWEEVLLIDCCPSSYLVLSCKYGLLVKIQCISLSSIDNFKNICSIFCIVSIKYFMNLQEEMSFLLVCSWSIFVLSYVGIVLLIDCCPSFYLVFSSKYGLLVKIQCISLYCIDNCKIICNIFCIVSIKYFMILQKEITFLHGVGIKSKYFWSCYFWSLFYKNQVRINRRKKTF